MIRKLITIFTIPELRRKILITLLFLLVYRIGYSIPLPMIDQAKLAKKVAEQSQGGLGQVLGLVSTFSGGNLTNACIFALGIMPYISASIILQLLAASGLSPYLERLRKEPNGQKKINEYTRYLTIPITVIQAIVWIRGLILPSAAGEPSMMAPGYDEGGYFYWFGLTAIVTISVGTLFLMWLGEQIDEYGIGNGISLIIMAGIIGRIPDATQNLLIETVVLPNGESTWQFKPSLFTLGGGGTGDVGFEKLVLMGVLFVAVIVAVVAITKAQRRIPTQSAKHVRGRRVYGGTRQFLPLKVNQAGVMPVIFASSLLIIPGFILTAIATSSGAEWAYTMGSNIQRGSGWLYNVMYIGLIYFFCYFWTAITFNPKDMATNLKDYGSFIPGYRPGKSTSDYLEKVLMRITFVGAAFLAVIAIIPTVISAELGISPVIAQFYGGTSLLITVSVCLDLVQKINSHLVMRNYPGLTED